MTAIVINRIRDIAELVKFSHTVFLLPFALSALVLANQVSPVTITKLAFILIALVSARTAAMLSNRLADRRFDAANPRTANRHSVTGRVKPSLALAWLCACCAVFVFAAAMLGRLCLWLSPVALAWVLGYSFTKRFTALCHLWLGSATALAPLGTWIAITGGFDWRALIFAAAVSLWVAGFDVIYACQDLEFDREQGLFSLPARMGLSRALWVSRGMHALAAAGFLALWPLFSLGPVYLAGALLVAVILAVEQVVVAQKRAAIPMAFFTLNGMVSVLYFFFLLADSGLAG